MTHNLFTHSTKDPIQHHKKRREHGMFSIQKKIQRLYFGNLVKIFNGTTVRLLLVGSRKMKLQKELLEQSKMAIHQFYCSLDSMKSGRQNLWNVLANYVVWKNNSVGQ